MYYRTIAQILKMWELGKKKRVLRELTLDQLKIPAVYSRPTYGNLINKQAT